MRTVKEIIWLSFLSQVIGCSLKDESSKQLTRSDTIRVIQAALGDNDLVSQARRSFGNKPLKLVRYRVIKDGYKLNFGGKPVSIEADQQQMDQDSLKDLLASVSMFKLISKDTAQISLIFYPSHATFLYTLVRQEQGEWNVRRRVDGKF